MSPASTVVPPAKRCVLGIGVSATSYGEVVSLCDHWISRRDENHPARYVCVSSVHGIMTAQRDPSLRHIMNGSAITTPDGMPLVWALRSLGLKSQQRVYGPTLMLHLLENAAAKGHRIFLYGGRAETLSTLSANLRTRFDRLNLVGQYSPPFRALTDQEEQDVVEMIHQAKPDIVFVGISTPKQEHWMKAHQSVFPGTIMLGVGAAFDFHAGRVKQAPGWMQRAGLEWLFRLIAEPRRLWKRYLLVTPWFIPFWALQRSGLRKYTMAAD